MKTLKPLFSKLTVAAVCVLLSACGGGGAGDFGVEIPNPGEPASRALKGPFEEGSHVELYELDASLNETGINYGLGVLSDDGVFITPPPTVSQFVLLTVTGAYYNEVLGTSSDGAITLRAYADLTENSIPKINVLTDMIGLRVKALVDGGMAYAAARDQAQQEALAVFNIPASTSSFDEMDFTQSGEDNAKLLAVSAILQGDNTVAELTQLLAKISLDLEPDGQVTDPQILEEICYNSMNLPLGAVRDNLETYLRVEAPLFEDWVNSDCDEDDIINKDDQTVVKWFQIKKNAPWVSRVMHDAVAFDNKLWLYGGINDFAIVEDLLSDLWFSSDGIDWQEAAAFPELGEVGEMTVFQNELWALVDQAPVQVLSSIDGLNWSSQGEIPYPHRAFEGCLTNSSTELFYITYPHLWTSSDGSLWSSQEVAFPPPVGPIEQCFHIEDSLYVLTSTGLFQFDAGNLEWQDMGELGFGPSMYISLVTTPEGIWLLDLDIKGNTLLFSEDGANWQEKSNDIIEGKLRDRGKLVWLNNLWLLGSRNICLNPAAGCGDLISEVVARIPYSQYRSEYLLAP